MYEKIYKELLVDVITNGSLNKNRTGIDSYSLFAKSITIDLNNGFPLITGKKMFMKNFIHEFIWFINGDTNINYLKKNNVNIWNEWANLDGNLGPTYGYQLRKYNGEIDQLKNLIDGIKTNKFSRRHIINLWNPIQLNEMALPPCYYSFQFYVNSINEISLSVSMRSGDLFLGVPYDIAFFSTMLIVIAKECNLKPKLLNINICDCHVYSNQLKQVVDYLQMQIYNLPKLTYMGDIFNLKESDFTLLNYKSNKYIKTKVSI